MKKPLSASFQRVSDDMRGLVMCLCHYFGVDRMTCTEGEDVFLFYAGVVFEMVSFEVGEQKLFRSQIAAISRVIWGTAVGGK